MSRYYCGWCRAEISSGERMISISLLEVRRKPKRWAAMGVFFDSGDDDVTLHAQCFSTNAERIARYLFPCGAKEPKKRPVQIDFPMWTDI